MNDTTTTNDHDFIKSVLEQEDNGVPSNSAHEPSSDSTPSISFINLEKSSSIFSVILTGQYPQLLTPTNISPGANQSNMLPNPVTPTRSNSESSSRIIASPSTPLTPISLSFFNGDASSSASVAMHFQQHSKLLHLPSSSSNSFQCATVFLLPGKKLPPFCVGSVFVGRQPLDDSTDYEFVDFISESKPSISFPVHSLTKTFEIRVAICNEIFASSASNSINNNNNNNSNANANATKHEKTLIAEGNRLHAKLDKCLKLAARSRALMSLTTTESSANKPITLKRKKPATTATAPTDSNSEQQLQDLENVIEEAMRALAAKETKAKALLKLESKNLEDECLRMVTVAPTTKTTAFMLRWAEDQLNHAREKLLVPYAKMCRLSSHGTKSGDFDATIATLADKIRNVLNGIQDKSLDQLQELQEEQRLERKRLNARIERYKRALKEM